MSLWRVHWQDFRGWRTTDFEQPYPERHFEDHPDREAAERAKRLLIASGMTACVSPTPPPRVVYPRRNLRMDGV